MPVATEFIAGTSGRIRSIKVTVSTTSDMPPGFNGTAFTLPARAVNNEVKSWKFSNSVSSETIITFESQADAQGVIYPVNLRGGVSGGVKIELAGVYNAGTGSQTHDEYQVGGYVVLDALYSKLNLYGYFGMICKVVSYSSGGSAGATPFDFSCSLELQGMPPTPAVGT